MMKSTGNSSNMQLLKGSRALSLKKQSLVSLHESQGSVTQTMSVRADNPYTKQYVKPKMRNFTKMQSHSAILDEDFQNITSPIQKQKFIAA